MALTALGYANALLGHYDRAVSALERAIEINPSSAIACWSLGATLAMAGQPDDAIPMVEKAIRLSPQDPLMHEFMFNIGAAHFVAERYDKAVEFAQRSLDLKSSQPGAQRLLAAAYGYLGNIPEAASALEKMLRVAPDMSAQHLRSYLPDNIVEQYIDGLRLAGWNG
jgi:adenylate cyclase